jgi:hypothetical protein
MKARQRKEVVEVITVIILLTVAAAIVAATIVTARRDGYGRVPDRMAGSGLERRARSAAGASISASRLA